MYFTMIAQNRYKMTQMTNLIQNLHNQVKKIVKYSFYDHGVSPLPKQNPYSKFILSIKTLSADQYLKLLQVLLGQTKIKILT